MWLCSHCMLGFWSSNCCRTWVYQHDWSAVVFAVPDWHIWQIDVYERLLFSVLYIGVSRLCNILLLNMYVQLYQPCHTVSSEYCCNVVFPRNCTYVSWRLMISQIWYPKPILWYHSSLGHHHIGLEDFFGNVKKLVKNLWSVYLMVLTGWGWVPPTLRSFAAMGPQNGP